MDLQSIYQTAGTVLFVLAGIFFAAAVVLFFLLKIPQVYATLHGKAVSVKKKRAQGKRGKPKTAAPAGRSGPSARVAAVPTGGRPAPVQAAAQQRGGTVSLNTAVPDNRSNTTVLKLENAPGSREEPVTRNLGKTGDLQEESAGTSVPIEEIRRRIGFRPEMCVLKFSAREKI